MSTMWDPPWMRCCVAVCKVRQRVKDNAMCRTHRKGKARKRGLRPARRREGGEAKGRPSHIGRAGSRDNPLQCIKNTRNTQTRCSESKHLYVSNWSKFEHWVSHAVSSSILGAENLWTGIDCRDNKGTITSIREENLELICQHSPRRRNLLCNPPVYKWLGLADRHMGSVLANWTVNFVADTIILVSGHKVLTIGSDYTHEARWLRNLLCNEFWRFLSYIWLFPEAIDSQRNPNVVLFTRES